MIFIGINDLAQSMGYLEKLPHPEMIKMADDIIKKLINIGKPVGLSALEYGIPKEYVKKDVRFLRAVCLKL